MKGPEQSMGEGQEILESGAEESNFVNFEEISENLKNAWELVDNIDDILEAVKANSQSGENKIEVLPGQFEAKLEKIRESLSEHLAKIESAKEAEDNPILAKRLSAAIFDLKGFLGAREEGPNLDKLIPKEEYGYEKAKNKLEEIRKLIN